MAVCLYFFSAQNPLASLQNQIDHPYLSNEKMNSVSHINHIKKTELCPKIIIGKLN